MSLVAFSANNHPQQLRARGAVDHVDDRWTPPEIFDPLHARYAFTLDVAASAASAKVPRYFDRTTDGLSHPWTGRVWCNPPYSNIAAWVEKAWLAMDEGAEVVVMLLPANRTEQRWWQEHVEPWRDRGRSEGVRLTVRFLPGRPRFYHPAGKPGGPKGDRPPFGLCLLTWERVA